MYEDRETWIWVDSRTDRRVSITSAPSRVLAQLVLDGWLARDARGGRPDIHDLMPFIVIRKVDRGETQTNGAGSV